MVKQFAFAEERAGLGEGGEGYKTTTTTDYQPIWLRDAEIPGLPKSHPSQAGKLGTLKTSFGNELGGGPKAFLLRACLPVRDVRRSGPEFHPPEAVLCHPVVPRVRLGTQHKAAYKTKRYKTRGR